MSSFLSEPITYAVTGAAAAERVVPLLRPRLEPDASPEMREKSERKSAGIKGWHGARPIFPLTDAESGVRYSFCDDPCVPGKEDEQRVPLFFWENARSRLTRSWRDKTRCYSHMPAASDILDDKWRFALLSDSMDCPTLKTHCVYGHEFASWAECAFKKDDFEGSWFLKDAETNGAGGVWLVTSRNWRDFASSTDGHYFGPKTRLVLQEHVPGRLRLWKGRKTHIRAYVLLTADGAAYVHRKCFLHAANKPFAKGSDEQDDQIHITNCCANSSNPELFAGEISIDFLDGSFCEYASASIPQDDKESGEFGVLDCDYTGAFASVSSSVAQMAAALAPFSEGAERNGGFEFIGVDFMVTWETSGEQRAWVLECNAPPGQGTASGLEHAERLHDQVHGDILTAWVLPRVTDGRCKPSLGGYVLVKPPCRPLPPSRASFSYNLARFRNLAKWRVYEKRARSASLIAPKVHVAVDPDLQSARDAIRKCSSVLTN